MNRLRLTIMAVALVALAVPASAGTQTRERTDILGQGGTTPAWAPGGAVLTRSPDRVTVSFRMRTPRAGTYDYPSADQVPPGASHPPVVPGDAHHPEVFTLWAFVFNHPELCSDSCDFDDIGDTPAKGGIYQLDGMIVQGRSLRMDGKIRLGQPALVGSALENPLGMEIHAAIAPHGRAHSGDDLIHQLNGSVGTPDHWWPALFIVGS